jgi:hypothetical protein
MDPDDAANVACHLRGGASEANAENPDEISLFQLPRRGQSLQMPRTSAVTGRV